MSEHDARARVDLLQGTLDLLILQTLRIGPAHGHTITKAIERRSDDVLQVEQDIDARHCARPEAGVSRNSAASCD